MRDAEEALPDRLPGDGVEWQAVYRDRLLLGWSCGFRWAWWVEVVVQSPHQEGEEGGFAGSGAADYGCFEPGGDGESCWVDGWDWIGGTVDVERRYGLARVLELTVERFLYWWRIRFEDLLV